MTYTKGDTISLNAQGLLLQAITTIGIFAEKASTEAEQLSNPRGMIPVRALINLASFMCTKFIHASFLNDSARKSVVWIFSSTVGAPRALEKPVQTHTRECSALIMRGKISETSL